MTTKYRKAARGQDCTFNIPGVCNYDNDTVVLCHLDSETKGMGMKANDISSADGCSACHDVIDSRVPCNFNPDELEGEKLRALEETQGKLFEKGLLNVV